MPPGGSRPETSLHLFLHFNTPRGIFADSASHARLRCETRSFPSAPISAKVEDDPSGMKIESQPNPDSPRGAAAISPAHSPRALTSLAPLNQATTQTAVARRSGHGSSIRGMDATPALFSSHRTSAPGNPPHAETASPESSTSTGRLILR